jgi:hypothetical protein
MRQMCCSQPLATCQPCFKTCTGQTNRAPEKSLCGIGVLFHYVCAPSMCAMFLLSTDLQPVNLRPSAGGILRGMAAQAKDTAYGRGHRWGHVAARKLAASSADLNHLDAPGVFPVPLGVVHLEQWQCPSSMPGQIHPDLGEESRQCLHPTSMYICLDALCLPQECGRRVLRHCGGSQPGA